MRRTISAVLDDVLVSLSVVLASIVGVLWISPPGPLQNASARSVVVHGGWKPLIEAEPPITWPCDMGLDVAVNLSLVPEAQRAQLIDDIDASLEHISAASPYQMRRTFDLAVMPTTSTLDEIAATGVEIILAVEDSARPDSRDLLSPDSYGSGGLFYRGPHAYVGSVLLDVRALRELSPGAGPRSHQALIIHELLHALGVGHTENAASIMQPTLPSDTGVLADIDLVALAQMNLLACGS